MSLAIVFFMIIPTGICLFLSMASWNPAFEADITCHRLFYDHSSGDMFIFLNGKLESRF